MYYESSFDHHLTRGVKTLIVANLVVFFIQILAEKLAPGFIYTYFALNPVRVIKQFWIWQLFTAIFMHDASSVISLHLVFNMLVLFFFGNFVEREYGTKRFIKLYIFCGIFSSLIFAICNYLWRTPEPMVGASGAIMGILVITSMIVPNIIVYFFFVIPMKLRTLVIIMICFDLYGLVVASNGKVAVTAHLGGALFGYLYYKFGDYVTSYIGQTKYQVHYAVQEKKRKNIKISERK